MELIHRTAIYRLTKRVYAKPISERNGQRKSKWGKGTNEFRKRRKLFTRHKITCKEKQL